MTIGLLSQTTKSNVYRLLDPATATNSPPSGAEAGLDITAIGQSFTKIPVADLEVFSTAGSDTMTVTGRLWGYSSVSTMWTPLDTGADATKGTINNGAAIGETGSNAIRHRQPLYDLHTVERLYLELTAIGGTATSVTANLIVPREVA